MAGSPENSTNQPLSRQAKDKIGNYYSSIILETHIPRERFDWSDFKDLNSTEKSHQAMGIIIPQTLADQLSLENLQWQPIGDQPTKIFIGKDIEKDGLRDDIEDAKATIEITGQSRRINTNYASRDIVVPFYLRIAGINKEQNRIVAATYDLEGGNRLIELNVSIPARESLSINTDDYLNREEISQFKIDLPTYKDLPYCAAGFITQAMLQKTEQINDSRLSEYAHKAIAISFGESNHVTIGRPETSYFAENLKYAFGKLGYYLYPKDGQIKVGLGRSDAERKRIQSWEISVPEFLPKAQ